MSLTSELACKGSPIRTYFDEILPGHRDVQRGWRSETGSCVVPPLSDSHRSEIGLAAGHLLAGLAVGRAGWGAGGLAPAVPVNPTIAFDFGELLASTSIDIDTAARASWYAGLFDRLGRGFETPSDPLLEAFAMAASLNDALARVPQLVVDDLLSIAEANAHIVESLPHPRIAGMVPTGAGLVGGADADLHAGSAIVELKTVVDDGLDRDHLRQLVSYALLDFDDVWGADEVAIWSLRFARLQSWSLGELLSEMAGQPTTATEQRLVLKRYLSTERSPLSRRPSVTAQMTFDFP